VSVGNFATIVSNLFYSKKLLALTAQGCHGNVLIPVASFLFFFPAVLLMYFISAAVILPASLALTL
jgi:hypothetical protein